jgi:hypothetical protein
MKRLAFLSLTIATLIAPIQVQAQTAGQRAVLDQISRDRVNNTTTLMCAMSGRRC